MRWSDDDFEFYGPAVGEDALHQTERVDREEDRINHIRDKAIAYIDARDMLLLPSDTATYEFMLRFQEYVQIRYGPEKIANHAHYLSTLHITSLRHNSNPVKNLYKRAF